MWQQVSALAPSAGTLSRYGEGQLLSLLFPLCRFHSTLQALDECLFPDD